MCVVIEYDWCRVNIPTEDSRESTSRDHKVIYSQFSCFLRLEPTRGHRREAGQPQDVEALPGVSQGSGQQVVLQEHPKTSSKRPRCTRQRGGASEGASQQHDGPDHHGRERARRRRQGGRLSLRGAAEGKNQPELRSRHNCVYFSCALKLLYRYLLLRLHVCLASENMCCS